MASLLGCLLGAATAIVTLRRWDVWRWLTVVAAAPVVLGGLLEVLDPGSVVVALLVGSALTVALWRARPMRTALVGAGALLAGAIGVHYAAGGSSSPEALVLAAPGALLALLAAAGLGRAAGTPALRLACLLAVLAPALAVAATAGDTGAALQTGPAGALGLTALLRGGRGRAS
ncbi:MAG: hypothetical protein QOD98_4664, partial [Nocardioidaceae bacterium]|nr:hypothetical protein [Nocardioidaceae bacterium]